MQRSLPQPGLGLAVVLCVLVVGVQMLLSTPLGVIDIIAKPAGFKPPHLAQHPLCLAVINVVAFTCAIVLGLALNRLGPSQVFPWIRPKLFPWLGCLMSVTGALILASELDNFVRWLLPPPGWITELMEQLLVREGHLLSRIFLLVIVAPVTEELLFRGIIFRGLLARYRFSVALLFSSLLFAGVHLNPWQFSSALLLGLMLAWFYFRTGSIALCIFGHAILNGAVLVAMMLPFEIAGLNVLTGGPELQLQPLWLDVAGLTLVIGGMLIFAQSTSAPDISLDSSPSALPPVIQVPPEQSALTGEKLYPSEGER